MKMGTHGSKKRFKILRHANRCQNRLIVCLGKGNISVLWVDIVSAVAILQNVGFKFLRSVNWSEGKILLVT